MPLEPIGTAPRTGAFIILHDEETGVYEVARWMKAEGRWSRDGGDPIAVEPTHWTYFPEGHGSRAGEGNEATERRSDFAEPARLVARRPSAARAVAAGCSTMMSATIAVGLLWLSLLNTFGLAR
jgi:hypothetical protein